LETSHNYARNVRICREISEELGFTEVKQLQEGKLRHVEENQEEAQKFINGAIREALKKKCSSPGELEQQLNQKGIGCKFTLEDSKLKYSSYSYHDVPIKGQDVGFTAKQLQARLEKNQQLSLEQSRTLSQKQNRKQGLGF
jgi:hypothetical protein